MEEVAVIYLSGAVQQSLSNRPDVGYMLTPNIGNKADLSNTIWAADTGCFSAPEAFSWERYAAWLDARPREKCLFATAPDVVGDAAETWKRSKDFLPKIRDLGYRAALVAQDGLMEPKWDAFDCLFIGGTTSWKLSEEAYRLAREADERGKWVHMGRVNSWRRLKAAAVSGYDSADGTYITFGPDTLLPRLEGWLRTLRDNPSLEAIT